MARWMIQNTELKEDGTEKGFKSLNMTRNRDKELKKKAIVFVDDNHVIHNDINTMSAARKAGLISEEEPPAGSKGGGPVITPDGRIEYTICLPPMAFGYFDIAKAAGFIKDPEVDFDQWVFDCIQSKFSCDYHVKLTLCPVSDKKNQETTREIARDEFSKLRDAANALPKTEAQAEKKQP
jgi:hypothetical protein